MQVLLFKAALTAHLVILAVLAILETLEILADSEISVVLGTSNRKKLIEVVAAVIQRDGQVLATQRGYGEYAGFWEFPGGKIEPGEEQTDALIREIREEMAARIDVDRFICTAEQEYPDFRIVMHCYLCRLASDYELLEHSSARWVDGSTIDEVDWLPADVKVVNELKAQQIIR